MGGLSAMHTAREVTAALAAIGVDGDAAAAILRETAPSRHTWRVSRAREVALEAAGGDALVAYALLALDGMGVGGRDACGGDGTGRLPAFSGLGKGRKQASDGGAWTSAILSAALDLRDSDLPRIAEEKRATARFSATPDGLEIELVDPIPEENDHRILRSAVVQAPLPWLRTAAREGLRRSVGLAGWHEGVLFDADSDAAPLWASLINEIERRMAQPLPVETASAPTGHGGHE